MEEYYKNNAEYEDPNKHIIGSRFFAPYSVESLNPNAIDELQNHFNLSYLSSAIQFKNTCIIFDDMLKSYVSCDDMHISGY
jgi:hypothetical protein